jgi:hypothetical protein
MCLRKSSLSPCVQDREIDRRWFGVSPSRYGEKRPDAKMNELYNALSIN